MLARLRETQNTAKYLSPCYNFAVMNKALTVIVLTVVMSSAAFGQVKSNPVKSELLILAQQFSDAIFENDFKAIEEMTAEDWLVIDADGVVSDKTQFITTIKSRTTTRSSYASKEVRVRIYEDAAIITALSTSEGKYMGKPFTSIERSTDVLAQKDGRWQFIHRHLTRIAKK